MLSPPMMCISIAAACVQVPCASVFSHSLIAAVCDQYRSITHQAVKVTGDAGMQVIAAHSPCYTRCFTIYTVVPSDLRLYLCSPLGPAGHNFA